MDRRALGEVVLLFQARQTRAAIAEEIKAFERCFDEVLQTATAFLEATEDFQEDIFLLFSEDDALLNLLCHFTALSNGILEFLDFQAQQTGLPSGVDISLESQVKAAQAFVEKFLQTFLLFKRAEGYPGKEIGMLPKEDVMIFGGAVFHRHNRVIPINAPDPHRVDVSASRAAKYWHGEHLFHPLRHVPGTQWHKYFGNLQPGPKYIPALFRENNQQPNFIIVFPTTLGFLVDETGTEYEKYRQYFENHNRLPGPRKSDDVRNSIMRRIQRRLSTLFEGEKVNDHESVVFWNEDMRLLARPEYESLGAFRLDVLNARANHHRLAGIALLGNDIPPIKAFPEGNPVTYWIGGRD